MNYSKLKIGEEAPEIIFTVIEIPQGSSNKYEFDMNFETIRLDRVLHSPTYYPGDYGFIPETLSEDGDPADVLVIISKPTFPGCLLRVKPIGLLKMEDSGKIDYKVLGVAYDDPNYKNVSTYKGLHEHLIAQIEHFFETYKLLENKMTKVLGWEDEIAARRYIKQAHEAYLSKIQTAKE